MNATQSRSKGKILFLAAIVVVLTVLTNGVGFDWAKEDQDKAKRNIQTNPGRPSTSTNGGDKKPFVRVTAGFDTKILRYATLSIMGTDEDPPEPLTISGGYSHDYPVTRGAEVSVLVTRELRSQHGLIWCSAHQIDAPGAPDESRVLDAYQFAFCQVTVI